MSGKKITKILTYVGLGISCVAALVSNVASERSMDEKIEAKVNEALESKQNEQKEES